eukprot:Awhi_evm1s5445
MDRSRGSYNENSSYTAAGRNRSYQHRGNGYPNSRYNRGYGNGYNRGTERDRDRGQDRGGDRSRNRNEQRDSASNDRNRTPDNGSFPNCVT